VEEQVRLTQIAKERISKNYSKMLNDFDTEFLPRIGKFVDAFNELKKKRKKKL
jgi:hypothetical protein